MASSASDAGYGEREIRRELIETGAVDVMVSIGTNFIYTRSLPCTLWFLDKAKASPSFVAAANSRQLCWQISWKIHARGVRRSGSR